MFCVEFDRTHSHFSLQRVLAKNAWAKKLTGVSTMPRPVPPATADAVTAAATVDGDTAIWGYAIDKDVPAEVTIMELRALAGL